MTSLVEKALAETRKIIFAMPDTSEGSHFGESAFKVKGKMFASCGEKHGVVRIVFGLEPAHAEALLESDPRFKPYSRAQHALWIDAKDVKKWSELQPLLKESYDLVANAKAKKSAAKKKTPAKAKRKG